MSPPITTTLVEMTTPTMTKGFDLAGSAAREEWKMCQDDFQIQLLQSNDLIVCLHQQHNQTEELLVGKLICWFGLFHPSPI